MISVVHLLWIIPLTSFLSIFVLAIVASSDDPGDDRDER